MLNKEFSDVDEEEYIFWVKRISFITYFGSPNTAF